MLDLGDLAIVRRQDLMREADLARVRALLPPASSPVRRGLAIACHRLADWLDGGRVDMTAAPQPLWHVSCALAGRDGSPGPRGV